MSHQLKLCTWKELKEVYGIPYCRMHIRRLELKGQAPSGCSSASVASPGWPMRSSSGTVKLRRYSRDWVQRSSASCRGSRGMP